MNALFSRMICCAFIGAALAGCGGGSDRPKIHKVHGKVTLDGKPLDGANISFIPAKGRPATGTTLPDGAYTLTTFNKGDGAISGEHTVIVEKYNATSKVSPGGLPELELVTPAKFGRATESDLKAKVTEEGANQFDFDLKK